MIRVDPITAAPDNTDRRVQFIVIVSIRPPIAGGMLLLRRLSSIPCGFATKIPFGGSFRTTPLGDRQRRGSRRPATLIPYICSLSVGLNYCSVLRGDLCQIVQKLNKRRTEPVGPARRRDENAPWSIGEPIRW